MDRNERLKRIEKVNQLTEFIGSCGRQFFYSTRPINHDIPRFAKMVMSDNGRLFWVDDYTGQHIYLHYRYWSHRQGFSHGGTLQQLVCCFKDYVMTGKKIKRSLGPFPKWLCDGDPWGYGGDLELVRVKAIELGIATLPEAVNAAYSKVVGDG